MSSNGFRQFITYTHSKCKISMCQCTKDLSPQAGIKKEGPNDRCPSNVSCCHQEATSKWNLSSFTDLHRHQKLYCMGNKTEVSALGWTRRWMRNRLRVFPTRYVTRNCLMTPGCLSLLAPGGTMGRFAKTWLRLWSSTAHGAWVQTCKGGPGAAQRSFSTRCWIYMFLLEWYSVPRFLKHSLGKTLSISAEPWTT